MSMDRKFARRRMLLGKQALEDFYIYEFGDTDVKTEILLSVTSNSDKKTLVCTDAGIKYDYIASNTAYTHACSMFIQLPQYWKNYKTLNFEVTVTRKTSSNVFGKEDCSVGINSYSSDSDNTMSEFTDSYYNLGGGEKDVGYDYTVELDINTLNSQNMSNPCVWIRQSSWHDMVVKNIWLGGGNSSFSGSVGEGGGSSGLPEEYVTYEIEHNYTNCESDNKLSVIPANSNYAANIIPNDGFEVNSVTIKMGETDVTENCSISYENGIASFTTPSVTGDLIISAIAEETKEENEVIYLFDSSREDNFIFGEYEYGTSSGITYVDRVSWPPSGDEENISSNQIILYPKPSGMAPVGSMNAYLKLYPNNEKTSNYAENTLFSNNVTYNSYAAGTVVIPICSGTVFIKAYKTGNSGTPIAAYCDPQGNILNQIEINGTSAQNYSFEVTLVSGGYLSFTADSGCNSFIINDIWFK